MGFDHALDCCPSCAIPLTLFTPRERVQHINECLDSERREQQTHAPSCAVCSRNLDFLTPVARQEHVNRCLDVSVPRPRQRQPVRKRPRSTGLPSSSAPRQPLPRKRCDEKVVKLLTHLGLERYAQRFADEEIDLDTLRILKDEDFVNLRIPDAARRRIADALHAVPILDRLQTSTIAEERSEPSIIPTQKFGTSKLGAALPRRKSLFEDDEDLEYRPTQTAIPNTKQAVEKGPNPGSPKVFSRSTACALETVDLITPSKNENKDKAAIQTNSQLSDDSDFDFDTAILMESQISLETKIEKWRKREMRKEEMRHQSELCKIESTYRSMMARLEGTTKASAAASAPSECITFTRKSEAIEQAGPAPIDLTTELSDEAEVVPESDPPKEIGKDGKTQARESLGTSNEQESGRVPVIDCCSDSDEEFMRKHVLRSPPSGYKSLLPALDFGSDSEILGDLNQKEKQVGSKAGVLHRKSNAAPSCEKGSGGYDLSHDLSSSSGQQECLKGDSPEKRQSSDLERNMTVRLTLSNNDADSSSSSGELQQTQTSRRKKKRGVSHEEISAAIRKDKDLYDRILKVESIAFDVILQSIRRSGTAVSRNALTNYLHSEGIMYKGDATSKSSKAYLNTLNFPF